MSKNDPAERTVRDIRRKTRKQYTAEEKIRIVVSGLRGEESIAALCRREGIAEAAKTHLAPKIERILTAARAAGKVTLMAASNADEARSYHDLGVRIFLAGIDAAIKRRGFFDALEPLNAALAGR